MEHPRTAILLALTLVASTSASLAACGSSGSSGLGNADAAADALVTPDGSSDAPLEAASVEPDASSLDALPTGAISFFDLSACPAGWSAYGALQGRAVVPVQGQADAGVGQSFGAALADGEDRAHDHGSFGASFAWSSASFAGAAGGTNPLGAAPADASVTLATAATSAGLPYVELLACQKVAGASPGQGPIPSGMTLFFASETCPADWTAATATLGRHLVGAAIAAVQPDASPFGATFGGPPLAPGERREHFHDASVAVTLPAHGVALASGAGAGGYAGAGDYASQAQTAPAVADVPYTQLLQCQKN